MRDLANAGGYQYGFRSGALMWLASALWPPWGLDRTTGIPPAYIIKPAYFFVIAGIDRKATEACAEYLVLLARMLPEFEAAHP